MTSQKQIDKLWDKAKPIRAKNSDAWRRDVYGNVIRKASFGTEGEYGWEEDHRKPKEKGGTDAPKNLQPLHWNENRRKGDKYPYKKKKQF